jgi:hypothetical protein
MEIYCYCDSYCYYSNCYDSIAFAFAWLDIIIQPSEGLELPPRGLTTHKVRKLSETARPK